MLLTPRVGQFAAMALAATEFTAKIFPIRIPRMRQEPNPAPAAADRTACQIRMSAQDGIQRPLKNAKFSVRMLMLLCMSPSYSLDAIASRGRAGIFSWFYPDHCSSAHTTDPPPNRHLAHILCADGHVSLSYHEHPTGKKEPAVTNPDSKTSPNYFSSKWWPHLVEHVRVRKAERHSRTIISICFPKSTVLRAKAA